MKKILLFVFFAFLSVAYVVADEAVPDGVKVEYYADGKIRKEEIFKDGVLHGASNSYYRNGSLMVEMNYENGSLSGPFKMYHENGILWMEFILQDKKIMGESKVYSKEGKLQTKEMYDSGILLNRVLFNSDGTLISEKVTGRENNADNDTPDKSNTDMR